jgi:signal transduction histidine kinase
MPPEVVKRIFEAFYSTKGETGTGLGLWLSLEIIKKCGSSMKVKSAEGRGTVFHLSLIGSSRKSLVESVEERHDFVDQQT